MIGTHNSATGMAPANAWSFLLTPFCMTQTKSLWQQWISGSRYFDIRIRFNADGTAYFCHGLWKSNANVLTTLKQIDDLAALDKTYISLTYEGRLTDVGTLYDYFEGIQSLCPHLLFISLNVKKPTWRNLYTSPFAPANRQGFKSLDGTSWHTYLPIPWLWNKVFKSLRTFSDDCYTLVDFL